MVTNTRNNFQQTDNAAIEQDVDLHTQLMESHGNLMSEAQDLRRRNRELEAASLESENEIRHASEQVFMAKENSKQKKRRGEVPLSAY